MRTGQRYPGYVTPRQSASGTSRVGTITPLHLVEMRLPKPLSRFNFSWGNTGPKPLLHVAFLNFEHEANENAGTSI